MHMGEVIRSNTCLILWKDHVFSKTTQVCLLSKPNQSMSENFKETKNNKWSYSAFPPKCLQLSTHWTP